MTNLQILYLALIFVAVASGVLGVANMLFRPRVAQQRLKSDAASVSSSDAEPTWQATVVRLAEPLSRLALPEDGLEYSRFRTRFMNAGWRGRPAMVIYLAGKVVLAFLLPLLAVAYVGASGSKMAANVLMLLVLFSAGVGFLLPNLILHLRIASRQRALFEAFPDAIDLLVVCVEAGLGLDAAIARASQEMRVRSPEVADELHLVTLELRVGATRQQALRNLTLRTGLDDVSALVTMLLQADRFGTNIADSLRVHADSLRSHRYLMAEEAAAKVPVKLVFPLVLCIFPSLMLVLAGPPFISIFRNLFPILSH